MDKVISLFPPIWAKNPVRVMGWLTALGIAVAAGVLVLGAFVLMQERADAWRQANQSSGNLVLTLERDIARNFAVLDLSLQGAVEALQQPGIDQVSPAIRQSAIFDRAAAAEYLGSLLVVDAKGTIVASSIEISAPVDLTDRDYFRVHQQHADIGLFVSHLFNSRTEHETPSIAISRRVSAPDGAFGGVVRGTLDVAYFTHLFENLGLGTQGTVALFRVDGQMITRYPFRDGDFGRDVSASQTFQRVAAAQSGSYTGKGTDNVTRLYTFRRVGDTPLIVSVGTSVSDIYAGWWTRALIIGGMLCLLCAAIWTLCVCFRREMLRRLAAESALADRVIDLAAIAATDGLTGLVNRVAFEGELDRAQRQSARTTTAMAILMLDADCFKAYNDQYGHQAGDQVLRSIAACIKINAQRPLDCAARYGGEEFVVLLPNTESEGAFRVAECIRKAIASLGIQHAGSPSGIVTVSIGVAAGLSAAGDEKGLMVRMADEALYAAKREGRNCSRVAQMMKQPRLEIVAADVPIV